MKNKAPISVGEVPFHHFPMIAPHLTTGTFMKPQPVFAFELCPKSHGSLLVNESVRLDPLKLPVLGQLNVRNRAFFVRYASVWRPFYSLISDTPYVNSSGSAAIPSSTPLLSVNTIMTNLVQYASSTSNSNYDFSYNGTNYNLNSAGRYRYKILKSLGYEIFATDATSSGSYTGASDNFSALPLLCYFKAILDWYLPIQYVNLTPAYIASVGIFMRENSYNLNSGDLDNLFGMADNLCYDSSYITDVWDLPNAPSSGAFSIFTLNGDSSNLEVVSGSSGVPYMQQSSSSQRIVNTAQTHELLMSLSSYLKRHQMAGAVNVDRWLVDFGITLRSDKLNRSYYLGKDEFPIQFGDVFSNSDTSGASLGDYAGRGIGGTKNKKFEFDSLEDFGFLIVINSISPDNGDSVQGIQRHVLHTSKFDFHTGVFDGKGTQAVSKAEVFVSKKRDSFNSGILSGIYGYWQRYGEMKNLRPMMSGDFMCDSVNVGLDAWHLFRMFDESSFNYSNTNVVHSPDIVVGHDYAQYGRIFNITDINKGDPFKCIFWFMLDMQSPMLPLYDDYLFHDEDYKNKVRVAVGGSKVD